MRTALTAICGFTILASGWLFVMFLVLRHPGFEWRAAMALGFVAVSAITLFAARTTTPPPALSATVALGGIVQAAVGAWAMHGNVDDGFVDVIGITFIAQGVLALAFVWQTVAAPATKRPS